MFPLTKEEWKKVFFVGGNGIFAGIAMKDKERRVNWSSWFPY